MSESDVTRQQTTYVTCTLGDAKLANNYKVWLAAAACMHAYAHACMHYACDVGVC